jgi:hypothetical protein
MWNSISALDKRGYFNKLNIVNGAFADFVIDRTTKDIINVKVHLENNSAVLHKR